MSSDCQFPQIAHFLALPISSECPFPRIAALFHSAELKNLHSMLRHRGTLFTRPTCCNTLQHIATHTATFDVQTWGHTPHVANTLQHTQQHTAQHTAAHAATHRTTHCNTHCNTLHNTLQHTLQQTAQHTAQHTTTFDAETSGHNPSPGQHTAAHCNTHCKHSQQHSIV